MSDEAKRVVEALRHVGTSLTNGTLNCGACPMQDIPVADLDCGSKCPETLMHLAADLIEHLSSVAERSSAKAALCEKVMEDYDKMRRERDRYWQYIKGMECESCSGDCDKCTVTKDGFTGWEWSGKEKAE